MTSSLLAEDRMPHRIESLLGLLAVLFPGFTTVMAAAVNGITSTTIWDKTELRSVTIIGASAGAYLAIAIFPPEGPDMKTLVRRAIAKMSASGIAGVVFTPILIRYAGWPADVDIVLSASAAIALCSVGILHTFIPMILNAGKSYLSKKLDKLRDESPPQRKRH